VLLDPFEEELHLPAAAIQVGDAQCGQAKMIGQEYEALVDLRIGVLDAMFSDLNASHPSTFGHY
jgi:hypothetical protein